MTFSDDIFQARSIFFFCITDEKITGCDNIASSVGSTQCLPHIIIDPLSAFTVILDLN